MMNLGALASRMRRLTASETTHGNLGAIHVLNPMTYLHGGSEQRALELYRSFSRIAPSHIWATSPPHSAYAELCPIRQLRPRLLQFPFHGTFIYVGTYWQSWRWLPLSLPRKIVIIHNMPDKQGLLRILYELKARGLEKITTVAYAAEWLRHATGIDGPIAVSPVDITRFTVRKEKAPGEPFVVGRMSRDVPEKHHPEDPDLYRQLAAAGIKVRIMGGTCLSDALSGIPNIELLPCGAEDPVQFLHSLDLFVYRTDTSRWIEPHGRVVTEALSVGLPVVCGDVGGFLDWVEHGVNGFIATSTEDIYRAISRLQDDPSLRKEFSAGAHRRALESFSPAAIESNLHRLLQPEATSPFAPPPGCSSLAPSAEQN